MYPTIQMPSRSGALTHWACVFLLFGCAPGTTSGTLMGGDDRPAAGGDPPPSEPPQAYTVGRYENASLSMYSGMTAWMTPQGTAFAVNGPEGVWFRGPGVDQFFAHPNLAAAIPWGDVAHTKVGTKDYVVAVTQSAPGIRLFDVSDQQVSMAGNFAQEYPGIHTVSISSAFPSKALMSGARKGSTAVGLVFDFADPNNPAWLEYDGLTANSNEGETATVLFRWNPLLQGHAIGVQTSGESVFHYHHVLDPAQVIGADPDIVFPSILSAHTICSLHDGNIVAVADEGVPSQVFLADSSQLARGMSPTPIALVPTPEVGSVHNVYCYERNSRWFIAIAAWTSGIWVFDVTAPAQPVQIIAEATVLDPGNTGPLPAHYTGAWSGAVVQGDGEVRIFGASVFDGVYEFVIEDGYEPSVP